MFLNDKRPKSGKDIFCLHIRKSGGSTLAKIYKENGWQWYPGSKRNKKCHKHSPWRVWNEHVDVSKYFWVAFIRNPYSRAVSNFFYGKKSGRGGRYGVGNFEEFAPWATWFYNQQIDLNFKNWTPNEPLYPQLYYITNEKGDIVIDFIGRQETMQDDFDTLIQPFNKKPAVTILKKCNTSRHDGYKSYYTPAAKKAVEKAYKDDIEFFNYEF